MFLMASERSLDQRKLADTRVASPFQVAKLKREVVRNWDLFWKEHQTHFFRDRHWTAREFDLLSDVNVQGNKTVLEVGCGVGNFIFPVLQLNSSLKAHACDFSPRAIDLLKKQPSYDPSRINAFVFDITADNDAASLSEFLNNTKLGCVSSVDIGVCLFVLSAIPPEKHPHAIKNIASALQPGSSLLFRDYALHDTAQLRFHNRSSHSYSDPSLLSNDVPLYRRADGTLSYFFTTDQVDRLMMDAGLDGNSRVVERTMSNRKEGITSDRRFVQGVYTKV